MKEKRKGLHPVTITMIVFFFLSFFARTLSK